MMITGRLNRIDALGLAALALLVLGTKAMFIHLFGSPVPVWDAWDAELSNLYVPYVDGSLTWSHLIAAHNEHRLLFTRLVLLGLFEVAGGWDPILGMMANGVIHTVFVVAFTAALLRLVDPGRRLLLLVFCVVLFMIPTGGESLIFGMNTHFPLMLLFALAAVAAAVRAPAFSPFWLIGTAIAVASVFNMASGALTPFAILAASLLQMVGGARRMSLREVLGCLVLVGVGLAVLATSVTLGSSDPNRASDMWAFFNALVTVGAVPLYSIVGVVFVHLPVVWLLWRTLRSRTVASEAVWVIIGLAAWSFGQMLALSFGRATAPSALRYLDWILILLPIDFAALLLLTAPGRLMGGLAKAARVYAAAWVTVIVAALLVQAYFIPWQVGQFWKESSNKAVTAIEAYLDRGDPGPLHDTGTFVYPNFDRVTGLLDMPIVRELLPAPLGPPPGASEVITEHTALHGRWAGIVSHAKDTLIGWPGLIALGTAMLLLAGLLGAYRREGSPSPPDVAPEQRAA